MCWRLTNSFTGSSDDGEYQVVPSNQQHPWDATTGVVLLFTCRALVMTCLLLWFEGLFCNMVTMDGWRHQSSLCIREMLCIVFAKVGRSVYNCLPVAGLCCILILVLFCPLLSILWPLLTLWVSQWLRDLQFPSWEKASWSNALDIALEGKRVDDASKSNLLPPPPTA